MPALMFHRSIMMTSEKDATASSIVDTKKTYIYREREGESGGRA